MGRKITHLVKANIDGAGWHVAVRATSERSARAANTRLHNGVLRGQYRDVQTRIVDAVYYASAGH